MQTLTDNDIIEICIDNGDSIIHKHISRKYFRENPDVYNYLKNRYNDSESIIETLYRIYYNIELRPVCKLCGGRVNFKNFKYGFFNFCSNKCAHLNKEVREKTINTCLEKYGVAISSLADSVKEKLKQTCLERYGSECALQNNDIKKKSKSTCLSKYGNEIPQKTEIVKSKCKLTCIKKYNATNPIGNDTIMNKSKSTCLEKYGVMYSFQSDTIKNKIKQTCLEKYGVDNVMKNEIILNKAKNTLFNHYNVYYPMQDANIKEKSQKTCLEKYGVKVSSLADSVKEKYKQTCLENYGEDNVMKNSKICKKNYLIRKHNNTLNSSKIEQLFKLYLEENYKDDYEYQYRSERYPFSCDFYIKSLDLYIEIQGSWTHGKHPYNSTNIKDIEIVNKWNEKANEVNSLGKKKTYYLGAIKTWTIYDPLKRLMAMKNKLNYLEIFSNNISNVILQFNNTINICS